MCDVMMIPKAHLCSAHDNNDDGDSGDDGDVHMFVIYHARARACSSRSCLVGWQRWQRRRRQGAVMLDARNHIARIANHKRVVRFNDGHKWQGMRAQ